MKSRLFLLNCAVQIAYFFGRALDVPDTTAESRRDGVKVAQDVSPG